MNLRVLVPDSTINYVTNPAMRFDATGYNAVGSTISRTLDQARFGIASLKVICNGSAIGEGAFYRVSSLSGISDYITASSYVRGQGKIRLRLIDNPTGKEWYSPVTTLNSKRWTRVSATGLSTGSNDLRIYVETTGRAQSVTFYADGFQMERKPYATTYCDGDQPGCRWNLVAHGSNSSRDAFTRLGGRWVPLAGPCRPDNDIYVTVLGGLGMPPLTNNIQPWANAPGSYFQNIKVLNRVVTLTFHAKHEEFRLIGAPKLDRLHELRQQLIDIIKPDRTQGSEAFLFEYDEGERPLYMRFRYEAGLEGEWDIRNQWVNSFPIRLLAVDPFFTEDNQNVADLDFQDTIAITSSESDSWARVNGVWNSMKNTAGFSLNGAVLCLAVGPKGEIYAGGNFTVSGLNSVAKWTGENWTVLGNNGANASVNAIAVAPDGTVYATGAFTVIGGVAANRVAKYNPLTNTWSAMSTGLNDVGRALCIAPNGRVYVGGDFTTAGGVTVNRICYWDGLQFRVVGTPAGLNNPVYSIVNAGDGATVYIGGLFTFPSAGGSPAFQRVAAIDLTTNLLRVTADAAFTSGTCRALAVGLDGTLYAGVDSQMSYLSGRTWTQLGDGLSGGNIQALSVGKDGTLYAGGAFNLSGTIPVFRLAKWSKGAWNPVDILLSKSSTSQIVYSLLAHPNGDLYVGADAVTTRSFMSGITIVTNEGTSEVQPTIYVSGPGILRFLENWTTKKRVYFNLTLLVGEEIFIDFSKSTIISNMRGSLMGYVLGGSDFKAFSLVSGQNQIAAFMTDDVGGLMKIGYVPQHWSVDSVIDAEELA